MRVDIFNTEKHYETACSWWKAYNWPCPPIHALSDTGVIVVDSDNQYITAAWIYETNSSIVLLEFIVANPEIKGEKRDQAFNMMMDSLEGYTKSRNFTSIFSSVSNNSLIKRLEKRDFQKTNENMTNFIRSL